MKTEISYKGMDRKAADEKALQDTIEYLGNRAFVYGDLVHLAVAIENKLPVEHEEGLHREATFSSLNMTFGFIGVTGYPFHAFCRRYCPRAYREWMGSGPDGIELDEQNFPIYNKEPAA